MRSLFGRVQALRHTDGQRGAAAVEFALVSAFLLTLIIGTLQYAFFFNDALSARTAVREVVRQGVVASFASCTGATSDMARLQCTTRKDVAPLTGNAYVRVVKPGTWEKGQPLRVCAMVQSDGGFGLLPMPNGGWLKTKTDMSIEQVPTPVPTGSTVSDTLPSGSGQNWNWC